ncbi:MAG: hypothetical protein AAF727_17585 [Pseudomonadota bacterium]
MGIDLPLDYRVIVNGYFPDYLYDRGVLNPDITLAEHYALGEINTRAQAEGLTEGFSAAIREGVPSP